MPRITLIAALGARTRAIGRNGKLLWHLPGDLPRFRALTLGHPVVMGSVTFASIGKPLPGRTTIVLTKDLAWAHEGVIVAHTLDEALEAATARDPHEVFVAGGGSVYAQAITRADRLLLTLVDDDTEGDTFFPDWRTRFVETAREEAPGPPPYAWATYEPRSGTL